MSKIIKNWDDGGELSVIYTGDGEGTAVFSSDVNEGVDKMMTVTFKTSSLSVDVIVRQVGRREKFNAIDGDFALSDGYFNVLKQ